MKLKCIDAAGTPFTLNEIYECEEGLSPKFFKVLFEGRLCDGWHKTRFEALTTTPTVTNNMSNNSPLEQSIIDVVKQHFNITLNDDKVKELIREDFKLHSQELELILRKGLEGIVTVDKFNPLREGILNQVDNILKDFKNNTATPSVVQTIKIEQVNIPTIEVDVSALHFNTPKLLHYITTRLPVYIFGPTGSSKTNVVFKLAKQLSLPIQSTTVSPQTPKSELLGYKDAHGVYQEGVCYKPFTEGGILLINELDNGNAASNAVLNQLMDDAVYFPCGMKERHKDFVLIATANTLGNGANRQYVGRSAQDKALLNRFVFLHWPWDTKLEARLANEEYARYGGKEPEYFNKILKTFWKTRKAIEELEIDHILSMRNLLQFARLLATGMDGNEVQKATISRGLNKEQWDKIIKKAGNITLDNDEDKIDFYSIMAGKQADRLITTNEVCPI